MKAEDKTFDIYLSFYALNNIKPCRVESLQFFNKVYSELGGVA